MSSERLTGTGCDGPHSATKDVSSTTANDTVYDSRMDRVLLGLLLMAVDNYKPSMVTAVTLIL